MRRYLGLGVPIVLGLALLADPVLAQCGGGGGGMRRDVGDRITTRYDETTNTTMVAMGPVGLDSDHVRVWTVYQCIGREPCAPPAVQLMVIGHGLGQSSEAPLPLVFALDGDATTEIANARFGSAADGSQTVAATVPLDEYLKIAGAKKVEVRYGEAKAALTSQQRAALRKFGKGIEKARSPSE